jgi:Lrp/AsnC family transcriptional regulator for asnA, asnC and gidA
MEKELENLEIDKLDLEIISILTENAFTPYTEIAKKLIVSGGTIHVRMTKLEKMGVIKSRTLLIDYTKMGYDLTAYIGVYLQKGSAYKKVITKLKQIPEILEAHYTTGNYSIFLKVVCRNTHHLRNVLNDHIQQIEGIERTETILSLEETVNRPININEVKKHLRKSK